MLVSNTPSGAELCAEFTREHGRIFEENLQGILSDAEKLQQLDVIQKFSTLVIKDASRRSPAEVQVVRQGLDVLWRMFLKIAQIIDAGDALHDKLVNVLLWTKEFDLSYRVIHPSNQPALPNWESYGFSTSLQSAWEQLLATGSPSQMRNLAAFSSKCLRVGLCVDALGVTTLWYLRESLETSEEALLTSRLPAAVAWIEHCREKLLAFSSTRQFLDAQALVAHLVAPGDLAQSAGVASPGCSVQRWLFWRRRLQELSHSSDPAVAEVAKEGFMAMVTCGRDLDYEVPGEARFVEKLAVAMAEGLANSGQPSLGIEEIDVDADWVD